MEEPERISSLSGCGGFNGGGAVEAVLTAMRGHEQGRGAVLIGTVREDLQGRLVMETLIGDSRKIDLPTGELVPRSC